MQNLLFRNLCVYSAHEIRSAVIFLNIGKNNFCFLIVAFFIWIKLSTVRNTLSRYRTSLLCSIFICSSAQTRNIVTNWTVSGDCGLPQCLYVFSYYTSLPSYTDGKVTSNAIKIEMIYRKKQHHNPLPEKQKKKSSQGLFHLLWKAIDTRGSHEARPQTCCAMLRGSGQSGLAAWTRKLTRNDPLRNTESIGKGNALENMSCSENLPEKQ